MAYDGWIEYNGVEIVNLARSTQLADAMALDLLRIEPETVDWIQGELGGVGYDSILNAPWYDPGYRASEEFAGVIPLSVSGLDDSTRESTPVEYTGDGGNSGKARSKTLSIVVSAVLIGSTDRGVAYGKQWLDRMLGARNTSGACVGVDLSYLAYAEPGAPKKRRRNVTVGRGTSVTRKRKGDCSSSWMLTFTLTADDPFEYGEDVVKAVDVGSGAAQTIQGTIGSGVVPEIVNLSCPVYDYSPIQDPAYPALAPSPGVPNFYPENWTIESGQVFKRYWVRTTPVEPSALLVVPVIRMVAGNESRRVRVAIWPSDSPLDDQCDPLFIAVATYVPAGTEIFIDGEQQACYSWIPGSPSVRRADSLIFGQDARPIKWTAFTDPEGFLMTVDVFRTGTNTWEGGDSMKVDFRLVPKSD